MTSSLTEKWWPNPLEKLTPKNIIRAGREHAIYLDAQIPKEVIRLKPHKECFDKILKNNFFR